MISENPCGIAGLDMFVNNNSKRKVISDGRLAELRKFCERAKIHVKNFDLLDLAFHHRSYSNENSQFAHMNNERLEFLGDSVLGLSTAAFLFADMPGHPEGDLAKIKSTVVSEQTLAPIALSLEIDKMLVLGRGEELSGGRQKKAILADCMEAVFGAYYLDQGFEKAEKLVLSFIVPEIRKVQEDRGQKDFKSLLQEYFQKKTKDIPRYELVKRTGPDHDMTFWVTVHLGPVAYGPESGKSKKEAEQNAAKAAWLVVTGKN